MQFQTTNQSAHSGNDLVANRPASPQRRAPSHFPALSFIRNISTHSQRLRSPQVAQLQNTLGNAGVARIVAQLKVGKPGGEHLGRLPNDLRRGMENLSGMPMGDVRVHYNSSDPVQLQAAAYTKGRDIYVGPGEERHLPHEAWHVVQQSQGRVSATTRIGGESVNDNASLEREADRMGNIALHTMIVSPYKQGSINPAYQLSKPVQKMGTVQLVRIGKSGYKWWENQILDAINKTSGKKERGWKNYMKL